MKFQIKGIPVVLFRCHHHLSFAWYGYQDKYYPFGIDLGLWGIRIQIKKPTPIKEISK